MLQHAPQQQPLDFLAVEARTEAQSARTDLQEAQQRNTTLETQIYAARGKVAELDSHLQNLSAELERERRAHAASTARGDTLSRQVDELKLEQSKSRQHFSAKLEKGRAAIDEAAQRATEAEHRALREIDRERTARAQSDKHLEQLRGKLAETERDHHAKLLEANAAQTRLTSELDSAQTSLAEIARASQEQASELQQALQAVAQRKARLGGEPALFAREWILAKALLLGRRLQQADLHQARQGGGESPEHKQLRLDVLANYRFPEKR